MIFFVRSVFISSLIIVCFVLFFVYSKMLKNVREAGKVRNIQNPNLGFSATIFWALLSPIFGQYLGEQFFQHFRINNDTSKYP